MINPVINAMFANGYLVSGATIVHKYPKDVTISIEEANASTDAYNKLIGSFDNPYYHIESDEFNDETGYSVPGLATYHRVTGKPIETSLQVLHREWQMSKATRLPIGWKPTCAVEAADPERTAYEIRMSKFVILD